MLLWANPNSHTVSPDVIFYFYTFKLVFSVRVKAILPIIFFFFRLASNALPDFGGRSDDAK